MCSPECPPILGSIHDYPPSLPPSLLPYLGRAQDLVHAVVQHEGSTVDRTQAGKALGEA